MDPRSFRRMIVAGVVTAACGHWLLACSVESDDEEEGEDESELATLPDELRNFFPGTPELRGSDVASGGQAGRAKLDPRTKQPLLVYKLPIGMTDREALDAFVTPRLDASYALVETPLRAKGTYYVLTYQGTPIESGWVRVYKDKRGAPAIAMSLPTEGLAPRRFAPGTAAPSGLAIVKGILTEFHRTPGGPGGPGDGHDEFPPDVGVPGKVTRTLTASPSGRPVVKVPMDQGNFPDEIGTTRSGDLWFSQPYLNSVAKYDVATGTFKHFAVGSEPDGLFVDRNDDVWFGEYGNHALGHIVGATGEYTSHHVPDALGSHAPAIPFMDAHGIVFVADHEGNMMLRFDPATSAFEAFPIPTAGSWPVGIGQAADANVVFVAETYAHKVAVFDTSTRAFTEYDLSTNGGTAFFTVAADSASLWFSLWSQQGFLKFDIATHETTEYTINDGTDARLGPTTRLPDGRIAFGGLANGRVYLFDPANESLVYVDGIGTLKDGMTARGESEIWVSEMGTVLDRIDWNGAVAADAGTDSASADAAVDAGSDGGPVADAGQD